MKKAALVALGLLAALGAVASGAFSGLLFFGSGPCRYYAGLRGTSATDWARDIAACDAQELKAWVLLGVAPVLLGVTWVLYRAAFRGPRAPA